MSGQDSLFAIIHEIVEEIMVPEGRILVVEDDKDLVHLLEYNPAKKDTLLWRP